MEEDISSCQQSRRSNPPYNSNPPVAPPNEDTRMIVLALCAPTQVKNQNSTWKNNGKTDKLVDPFTHRKEERRRRPPFAAAGKTAVSIYKIPDLSCCCCNVLQQKLRGCAVVTKGILVVEGEIRSAKRCLKVMLRRKGENLDSVKVIWQGKVGRPSFGKFSILHCTNDVAVCKFFADHGASHYWDLAVKSSS